MKEEKLRLELLEKASLFEEIHQLKGHFVKLFSAVANQIDEQDLLLFHPQQQGVKITKGNALQHCPYQVLDIVRCFDQGNGLNIRLLNWWGHGLYLLVFYGKHTTLSPKQYQHYLDHDYQLALTGSPWDYTGMIKHQRMSGGTPYVGLEGHIKKYNHVQLIKHIPYKTSYEQLKQLLLEEWRQLKKIHTDK